MWTHSTPRVDRLTNLSLEIQFDGERAAPVHRFTRGVPNMADKKPVPAKAGKTAQPLETEKSLYASRSKIYVRHVTGFFARWRVIAVWVLLGSYYLVPWIEWGGRQAVLFDLPERKFYIFGWVFWPQDFFYLTVLLIIAALSLFFFTALAGRLWCGYACPQTVWTEVFIWMERRFEGDRPKAMKLDKMPWTREKIMRKGGKHAAWLIFSLFTGYTFVGYFTPIQELSVRLVDFQLGPWETFWVFFYGFATYLNAGWLREQVCIYMCPYARFQSAMFDRNTLVIGYDEPRGEPRGRRNRKADPAVGDKGDCIDCSLCVQVCPVGIDIRDGLQYQCIACAACIDVCDEVMAKVKKPKGLIRYSTENAMELGEPIHIMRPRVIAYSLLLLALTIGLVYAISVRVPLRVDIIRDRMSLFSETRQGDIINDYTVKVLNMDEGPHVFHLAVEGLEGMMLTNQEGDVEIASGAVVAIPVRVQVAPENIPSPKSDIEFILTATDNPELKAYQDSRFLAPKDL